MSEEQKIEIMNPVITRMRQVVHTNCLKLEQKKNEAEQKVATIKKAIASEKEKTSILQRELQGLVDCMSESAENGDVSAYEKYKTSIQKKRLAIDDCAEAVSVLEENSLPKAISALETARQRLVDELGRSVGQFLPQCEEIMKSKIDEMLALNDLFMSHADVLAMEYFGRLVGYGDVRPRVKHKALDVPFVFKTRTAELRELQCKENTPKNQKEDKK